MSHRVRRTRTVAAALGAAALLASCAFGGDGSGDGAPALDAEPLEPVAASASPVDGGLARFYDQEVSWRGCRGGLECTEIEVPLDYAEPEGEAISLAVLRVPATDEERRIGSLVVNPGGPGVSGMQYAAAHETFFGENVRAVFDIVGFDPRGVGESTPVDCVSDEELDALFATDPDPDTPTESAEADRAMRELGQGCLERSGQLAAHVSTVEAARDVDVLRAVLGQDRLAYFGASYGTYLGATYADLFPQRVGRLVLDGAVDPSLDSVETGLVQAKGFEVALRAYVGACVEEDDCFLGSTVEEGTERVAAFLDSVDTDPLPGIDDRELTQGRAVYGVWAPLYSKESWPLLDEALSRAFDGDGELLLAIADSYLGRGPKGYVDNAWEALYAVNCLDPHDDITSDEARELEDRFLRASPTFGRSFAASLAACAEWPVDAPTERPVLDAPGAAPILVVGTTRDPATPLAWAEALADQLSSGVLVRRDGDGHVAYRKGNECVDATVEAYLVSGTVPAGTVDC